MTSRVFWRWVLLALGVLVLSLLTWFAAPHLSILGVRPLAGLFPRLLVQCVILLFALLIVLVWRLRHKPPSSAQAVVAAPVAASQEKNDEDTRIRAEITQMTEGFQQALDVLRRMRGSRKFARAYAYQLPWYLVMGPTGSGKTSFIRHSGLRFPVAERSGGKQDSEAETTFFFTNKAVLIDTQGPFRGDGVLSGPARKVWTAFIDQLKKVRSRQPINGVLFLFNLETFVGWDEVERATRAADIRQQLVGLQASLKMRFPVYVVFTGLDRVPGFKPLFEGLSAEDRGRAFGLTFPFGREEAHEQDESAITTFFNQEYLHLLQWQRSRMLNRVHEEPETEKRFDAYMFLPHLAALRPMLSDFLEDVFKPSGYERALLLRGLYFTSAQVPSEAPEAGPSRGTGQQERPSIVDRLRAGYFSRDILEKVIFEEAGLVGVDSEVKRRQTRLQWGLTALIAVIGLCFSFWWAFSYATNEALIQQVDEATAKAEKVIRPINESLARTDRPDLDLASTIPALTTLAALPTGWDSRNDPVPLVQRGGLSQLPALSATTQKEYHDGLRIFLLPRLVELLQRQMVATRSSPEDLYDVLMVYLMMGGKAPVNHDVVLRWADEEFSHLYPGAAQERLRATLHDQVANLLEAGFPPISLNQKLVDDARVVLGQYPPSQRGLAILEELPEVVALKPWRLQDVAGPLANYALVRRSGQNLAENVPGMYLADNFFTIMVPAIGKVAEQLVRDDWVRLPEGTRQENTLRASALREEMLSLFANAYINKWEDVLNDVTLASFSTLQQEVSILKALVGPPSPLKNYLSSVVQQTTLTPPEPKKEDGSAVEKAVQQTLKANTSPQPASPGAPITNRFASLREFVGGASSPLDEVMKQLVQLSAIIGPVASADGAVPAQITDLTSGPAFTQILNQLRLSTISAPPALGDSILALVRETTRIANAGLQDDMNSAWKTMVLPFCNAAIRGRYPASNSRQDMTIADFSRFFAPEGILDQFFQRHIKPFVDTGVTPWRVLRNAGAQPALSPEALSTFEQAARIRTVFFLPGAATPQLLFNVTPVDLDAGAMRVKLDIDGQSLIYQYGPPQTVSMKWPGASSGVRVEFGAQQPGQPSSITVSGPWALLRFLKANKLRALAADRFSFEVNLGERSASFLLNATSVDNPFASNPLAGFKCPQDLTR
ncbi:type VI secretion system membrane subunit TssM [Xanthobacter sp. TB0139]|uniref:type VI secretion system membrane subunit TssM n=1 Tax=Xanthobacter sp. TB0139 TaxID=3459178 RepID=UPI00403973BA